MVISNEFHLEVWLHLTAGEPPIKESNNYIQTEFSITYNHGHHFSHSRCQAGRDHSLEKSVICIKKNNKNVSCKKKDVKILPERVRVQHGESCYPKASRPTMSILVRS